MSEKTNPGNNVMCIGLLVLFVYVIGLLFGLAEPRGQQPTVAMIVGTVILGLTIFIASVVGAYYAGKEKR